MPEEDISENDIDDMFDGMFDEETVKEEIKEEKNKEDDKKKTLEDHYSKPNENIKFPGKQREYIIMKGIVELSIQNKKEIAIYRDLIEFVEKYDMDKITLEETITELLDAGEIYEPTIGLLKAIGINTLDELEKSSSYDDDDKDIKMVEKPPEEKKKTKKEKKKPEEKPKKKDNNDHPENIDSDDNDSGTGPSEIDNEIDKQFDEMFDTTTDPKPEEKKTKKEKKPKKSKKDPNDNSEIDKEFEDLFKEDDEKEAKKDDQDLYEDSLIENDEIEDEPEDEEEPSQIPDQKHEEDIKTALEFIDPTKDFDFNELEESSSKLVFTYYGDKGEGKTNAALSHPGIIACLSFDNQSYLIKENMYDNDERIHVFDPTKYMEYEDQQTLVRASKKTYDYIRGLIHNIGKEITPDWIIIDGSEILQRICEWTMRDNNEIKAFEGFKNLNLWKERNQLMRNIHNLMIRSCKRGVIYTTYTTEDEIIIRGTVHTRKKIPKWISLLVEEANIVIQVKRDPMERKYLAICDSSKIDKMIESGAEFDFTDKQFYTEFINEIKKKKK